MAAATKTNAQSQVMLFAKARVAAFMSVGPRDSTAPLGRIVMWLEITRMPAKPNLAQVELHHGNYYIARELEDAPVQYFPSVVAKAYTIIMLYMQIITCWAIRYCTRCERVTSSSSSCMTVRLPSSSTSSGRKSVSMKSCGRCANM